MSNGGLQTEEFARKKNYKGLIVFLIIVLLIVFLSFMLYKYIVHYKEEKRKEKSSEEVLTLNEELQNLYGFAISDNYIVALKKDGKFFKIYNLLQGTGNLGDFTFYSYYDNKLYLLYSDNTLYTISLDSGNGIYELKKSLSITPTSCLNGDISRTSELAFYSNNIYINNSNCSITRNKFDKKNSNVTSDVLKVFNNKNVSLEYSDVVHSVFVYGDNSIYKFDNTNGQISTIVSNISNSVPLEIKSNILVYSNIVDNKKVYYGYNVATNTNSQIVIADDLIIYEHSFIYLKDNAIYMLTGDKEKVIYNSHYDTLSNLELINTDTLQIVDASSVDSYKKRIINIDLSSKQYNTIENKNEFTSVVEYIK